MHHGYRPARGLSRFAIICLTLITLAAPATSAIARQDGATPVSDRELRASLTSSQDLIANHLESGDIDDETSLVYRAFALFDDQRLPAELSGDGAEGEDAGLFAEATYYWNSLSKATRESLTPFIVRPTDSRSLFYLPLSEAGPSGALTEPPGAPSNADEDALSLGDAIPNLSAPYDYFVAEPDVTQVTLDFSSLTPNDALDVDLIVKIKGGAWERRQLATNGPINFCRSDPADNIDRFYVVISNHALTEETIVRGATTVRATAEECG